MTTAPLINLTVPVFVLALAALAGAGLLLVAPTYRLRGVAAHRFSSGFWLTVALFPLAAGLAAVGTSLASVLYKALGWIEDHCARHGGHPHLCWEHAAPAYSDSVLLWTLAAVGAAWGGTAVWRTLGPSCRFHRRLGRQRLYRSHDGFWILPSRRVSAFVAGFVRPRAYLTTAALTLLTARERTIIQAHESAHIQRRDTLGSALMEICSALFPWMRPIYEKWLTSVEIECDRAALRAGASAREISGVILKLARASKTPDGRRESTGLRPLPAKRAGTGPAPAKGLLAYAGGRGDLKERLDGLWSSPPPVVGRGYVPVGAFLGISGAAALWISPLHHALETALGWLIGA